MNAWIEFLNRWGDRFLDFAGPMLWQSSLLIVIVWALDRALRRKVRAAIRYLLWLVVLGKLLLPPTLSLPTGVAWWLRPGQNHQLASPPSKMMVSHRETPAMTRPPSAPAAIAPPAPALSGPGWALATTMTISLTLLGWLILHWRRVFLDVRGAGSPSEDLRRLLIETQRLAAVRGRIHLRVPSRAMSPAVCGFFRPVVVLPQCLVGRLTNRQLRAVLLHELIHVRRHDVWVNCLQALLQIAFWWHPLVWLANARIRRAREEAVDDAVMLALAEDAGAYAPTLLEVARLAFNRPLASLGLVGILESHSALRQRIERLVHFAAPRRAGISVVSLLCVSAFAALAVPMGEAPAPSTPPAGEPGLKEDPTRLVTLTARFYKMTSDEFLQLRFGPSTQVLVPGNSPWWRLSPENLDQLRQRLESMGLEPFQIPRIKTSHGAPANMFVGTPGTNIEFELIPSMQQGGAELTVTLRTTGYFSSNPAGDWPALDGRTNCAFFGHVGLTDGSGALLRVKPDSADQNLVVVLKAELETRTHQSYVAAPRRILALAGSDARAPQVSSDEFEFDTTTDTGIYTGHVTMTNGDATLTADRASYHRATGEFIATGHAALRKGGNVATGDRIVYQSKTGTLRIEPLVLALNRPPPQVNIKVKFIEVPENANTSLDLDALSKLTNPAATNLAAGSAAAVAPASFTGILDEGQHQKLLRTLENREGPNLLSESQVTTLSGRQAQIQVMDLTQFATNINPEALHPPGVSSRDGTNALFQYGSFPAGPSVDLLPIVHADTGTIELTVNPTLVEFLGYEKAFAPITVYVDGKSRSEYRPMPRFSVHQLTTHVTVADGQTILMVAFAPQTAAPPSGLSAPGGSNDASKSRKRQLLVLVTPTLLDEFGNRIAARQHPVELHQDDLRVR
jgi:beta-lactamase regulating signal transducer with metallopeptidase domain/lipopolysaccharide export system protein LptA